MRKTQIRNIITNIHFYLLGFAILNFILKNTIEISLNYKFSYLITVFVYVSGIILFIWNFKPFKKLAFYFSIYILTPIFTLLFWIFGGIFFGILTSILLYPIFKSEIKAEKENIVIYSTYQGFLSSCCSYDITEKQFLVLEKRIKKLQLHDEFEFNDNSIIKTKQKTELKMSYKEYDFETKSNKVIDTIITIKSD
ncbi:MAG: hypothetical protein GYB35_16035 [Algicola sp.]|nr:hypothetical protein [Algicola sp.]